MVLQVAKFDAGDTNQLAQCGYTHVTMVTTLRPAGVTSDRPLVRFDGPGPLI